MSIRIWQSYSCNNSSNHRLVARFSEPSVAAETERELRAVLAEHVNPFNNALQMPDVSSILNLGTDAGRALMEVILLAQSQIIAFSLDFQLIAIITVCAIPLTFMLISSKSAMRGPGSSDHAAVME